MADETPAQISEAGLEGWYSSLSSQDKVRTRRYLGGIDTSSPLALLLELMARAEEDHNYKLAVSVGEHLESVELSDLDRFRATEAYIEGLFGCDRFEDAKRMCVRNLELYPSVAAEVSPGGEVPKTLYCRSRLIDILVGVDADYDSAFRTLDVYEQIGLIDAEEKAYRVQSLKIHRMQMSFDNIFNYKKLDE